ncbi:MAG: hypothetical protein U1F35_15815 [Steroidobacteraceae bacterium]
MRIDPVPPSRGLILDRRGVVLAENLPAFQLELECEQVGKEKDVEAALGHRGPWLERKTCRASGAR